MRILIVDDHPLTCNGLRLLLQAAYPAASIATVHGAAAARQALAGTPTHDWIFLDIELPDDPQRLLYASLSDPARAGTTILISAQCHATLIRDGLLAGMRGFIPKSADPAIVLDGVRRIFSGDVYLPPDFPPLPAAVTAQRPLTLRQQQVLELLLKGYANKVIARELDLTLNTVKEYVSVLLKIHGVASRLELILKRSGPA
jgi:two-component system nitrate/nitrite response regulator NarL